MNTLFEISTGLNFKKLTIFGDEFVKTIPKIRNPFWHDCLNYWCEFNKKQCPSMEKDVLSSKLWFNSKILIDKKPIFYKKFAEKNIYYISDLLDENGTLFTYTFSKKYKN